MQINRRGQKVALAGAVLQAGLAVLAAALWLVSQSAAAWPVIWMNLAALPLWILTAILFHCRHLARREEWELEQFSGAAPSGSIFIEGKDALGQRPAAARLRWMERYLVAVVTIILSLYQAVMGLLLMRWLKAPGDATILGSALTCVFFAGGGAFLAFLVSRYATGMAKTPSYSLLRAPGSFLFANCLGLALLALALLLGSFQLTGLERVLTFALPILMVVVGAEMGLNFVLDLYRPRLPGVEHRFSFEVSSTWFYKLLRRTFMPLLACGGLILWLLTGLVVVDEGQQYVVLHWGQPTAVLEARSLPHLIWPWPIDTVKAFDASEVKTLELGVGGQRQEDKINGKLVYLWGKEHGNRLELDTLVAAPAQAGRQDDFPNIIKFVVRVSYHIADARSYGFRYTTTGSDAQAAAPDKVLEAIAYREMVTYAASATLDEPLPAGSPANRAEAIMTFGQAAAAKALKQRIASRADQMQLGVEILGVQILACHPPTEAAEAFEGVISAELDQDRQRFEAQADANKTLATVAGSPEQATIFVQASGMYNELRNLWQAQGDEPAFKAALAQARAAADERLSQLRRQAQTDDTASAEARAAQADMLARQQRYLQTLGRLAADASALPEEVAKALDQRDTLLEKLTGSVATIIAQARADRWKNELRERSRAQTFDVQLAAMKQAPDLYMLDRYLQALNEGLRDVRKYVIGLSGKQLELWLDLKQPQGSPADMPIGKEK
jgi:regulator of protease activity HflC (stomatin/prohibitin superfamily)